MWKMKRPVQRGLFTRPVPLEVANWVLEVVLRFEAVYHDRAHSRGTGITAEVDRGSRRAEEDPVLDFNAGCYYEIEYVLPKGGGKGG